MGPRLARGCPDASRFSRAGDMPGGCRDRRLRDGSGASFGFRGAYGRSREDSKPRNAAWRLDRGARQREVVIGLPEPRVGWDSRTGGPDPCHRARRQRENLLRPGRRQAARGSARHPCRPVAAAAGQRRRAGAHPGATTAGALTSASFAAVQPGQVTVTAVRPPCHVAVPPGKNELEPADPLPSVYPLKSCPPGHRFSVLVIVQR